MHFLKLKYEYTIFLKKKKHRIILCLECIMYVVQLVQAYRTA